MAYLENEKELKILAKNIAYLRKENRLSKKEMSALLKIGVQSLTQIENGELPPRLHISIIFEIQNIFGIAPKTILTRYLGKDENCV